MITHRSRSTVRALILGGMVPLSWLEANSLHRGSSVSSVGMG